MLLLYFSEFKGLIDKKDADGKTSLHLALEAGMYTKVEILLDDFGAGTYVHAGTDPCRGVINRDG